uniref:Uncharacterized protein n=1 Tax=Heterorhabditis bacteriophora TaxID=37862 RepID=A0A1I7X788_HETBA
MLIFNILRSGFGREPARSFRGVSSSVVVFRLPEGLSGVRRSVGRVPIVSPIQFDVMRRRNYRTAEDTRLVRKRRKREAVCHYFILQYILFKADVLHLSNIQKHREQNKNYVFNVNSPYKRCVKYFLLFL